MKQSFSTATEVFDYYYDNILLNWSNFAGTKTLFNNGFYIMWTSEGSRIVSTDFRNLEVDYIKAEWKWYLSGDPSVNKLWEIYGKVPAIWKRMADEEGNVNSNYWTRWMEGWQLEYVINELKNNPESRRACITIFDGKNHEKYSKDTPCTMGISFFILDWKLEISVMMRSNDLWFGTPIDVYCFSMLQKMVAEALWIQMWWYHHFNVNFHLYERHWEMKENFLLLNK